jgi:hypothetical protein
MVGFVIPLNQFANPVVYLRMAVAFLGLACHFGGSGPLLLLSGVGTRSSLIPDI